MGKIIGIDLGTTNSCAAFLDGAKPRVIPTKEGRRVMPSVVAQNEKKEWLIGTLAKRQMRLNPENTVFAIKRLMGRKYDHPSVQEAKPFLPYRIAPASNGDVRIIVQGQQYSPAELSAMVLARIKEYAEEYLEDAVKEAIVSVPAYYDDAQRQATKDAGRIAGFDVKRLLNEPTAASVAYGIEMKEGKKIAIYDLGGGTFDITLLLVGQGVFEVLSTSGDTFLGGHDFDQRISKWMVEEFQKDYDIDLMDNRLALQRIIEEAEKVKCDLSSAHEIEIHLPFLYTKEDGTVLHFQKTLTRAQLETMCQDLIERTEAPCQDALSQAGLRPDQIDEVLLVGGQTRMPKIQQKVAQVFQKAPNASLSPDEVVGMGAALQAGILKGEVKDIVLLDVTPLTLCLETQGGICVPMIPRNSSIPTKKSRIFTTVADNQTSVEVHILQGESQLVDHNRSLGKFELRDIPPAPRGLPEIDVTFSIDANGIVNVSAIDKASGKAQNILIQPSSGLTEAEIQRIIKKADETKEEEVRRIELVQLRNRLTAILYQSKRSFDEYKDLLGLEQRKELEDLFRHAERTVNGGTVSECQEVYEKLVEATKMISAATIT